MVRNVLGSLIALIGATAAVWSPFRPWYDGRHGSDVRIEDLFSGISGKSSELFGSVFLPMAFAALVTLIGVALRSRALLVIAGLVVLGFTILWMVRQGQASGELTTGSGGLGIGVAAALGGGVLLLLGALVMRGRGSRARGRGDVRRDEDAREPYPAAAPEPWDPGRPVTQEWNPEPFAGDPAGRGAHYGSGEEHTPPDPGIPAVGGARQDPSPDPWPGPPQAPHDETQQIPRTQQTPQPQQDRQPPPPPPPQPHPPTQPDRPQPPTPPVEWGKEHRQTGPRQSDPGHQQPPDERE